MINNVKRQFCAASWWKACTNSTDMSDLSDPSLPIRQSSLKLTAYLLTSSSPLTLLSLPLLFLFSLFFFLHNQPVTFLLHPTSILRPPLWHCNIYSPWPVGFRPLVPRCLAFYSAAPLTSAGIIPIMQSLCPDGQRDEFGFLQYKNSTWVDITFYQPH